MLTPFAEKDYNGVIYILGLGPLFVMGETNTTDIGSWPSHYTRARMTDNIAGYADTSMPPFSFFLSPTIYGDAK
jgi:hypothetical protein